MTLSSRCCSLLCGRLTPTIAVQIHMTLTMRLYPRFQIHVGLLFLAGTSLVTAIPSAVAGGVELYGGVDIGVSYVHTSGSGQAANRLGMDSNVLDDTMIGFRGTEALSPDWSVSFNLASEFDLNNGQLSYDSFFGIESTIGITRQGWGAVKLGRQQTISTNFFTNIDPMGLSFGQANMGTSFTAINTQIYNDLIQFTSANWSGLQLGVGYSFDTGDTAIYADSGNNNAVPSNNGFASSDKMRALTAAVQYQQGPVLLVASYDRAYASNRIPDANGTGNIDNPQTGSPQAWYLGTAVTIEKVVLSAALGRGMNGALSGSGPGSGLGGSPLISITGDGDVLFDAGFNHDSYLVGLSWAINDRTQFMTSWQMMKPKGALADISGTASQQIIGAALTYNLSPRTTAYVWGSYGNNFQMVSGAKSSVIGTGFQTLF